MTKAKVVHKKVNAYGRKLTWIQPLCDTFGWNLYHQNGKT